MSVALGFFHYESVMALAALTGATAAFSHRLRLFIFIPHVELTKLLSQLWASKNGPHESTRRKSISCTCGRFLGSWPDMKFSLKWKINRQIGKRTQESTWSWLVSVRAPHPTVSRGFYPFLLNCCWWYPGWQTFLLFLHTHTSVYFYLFEGLLGRCALPKPLLWHSVGSTRTLT